MTVLGWLRCLNLLTGLFRTTKVQLNIIRVSSVVCSAKNTGEVSVHVSAGTIQDYRFSRNEGTARIGWKQCSLKESVFASIFNSIYCDFFHCYWSDCHKSTQKFSEMDEFFRSIYFEVFCVCIFYCSFGSIFRNIVVYPRYNSVK